MNIKEGLKITKNSAFEGMKQIRSLTGTVDPVLRAYNSMSPSDLDVLAGKYGTDRIMTFIKDMETKRLMGGE